MKYGNENGVILKDLFLCTYNVWTLSKDHHLESLLHEINPIKWHIIGLLEISWLKRMAKDVDLLMRMLAWQEYLINSWKGLYTTMYEIKDNWLLIVVVEGLSSKDMIIEGEE